MSMARTKGAPVRRRATHAWLALVTVLGATVAIARPARAMQNGTQNGAQAAAQGVAATSPDSTTPSRVSGIVYDSVARAPLANAVVQLVEATHPDHVYNTNTDSLGAFTFPSVRPGRYAAGFFHPSVDALGIEIPLVGVDVAGGRPVSLPLGIPGPGVVSQALCGKRAAGDSSGALVGQVRDANTGTPVAGARVVVSWLEINIGAGGLRQVQQRVPAQTRADGGYAICGLPDDRVIVSADSGASRTGLLEVEVPTRSLVRRDLSIAGPAAAVATPADSTPGAPKTTVLRGTARLTGTVRRPDGHPMSGARVSVWGSGLSATTDAEGRFALSGLPAGTFSAQARAIGYTPVTAPVDLASDRTASVDIRLTEQATTLAPVTVYGKASGAVREMNEFLERKRQGMGHFLTTADLQNRFAVTDALRMVPGIHVMPTMTGETVYGRQGCIPAVYLDGMPLPSESPLTFSGSRGTPPDINAFVQPSDIMGIEVYSGLGEAPPQYSSNACAVILIWTRR